MASVEWKERQEEYHMKEAFRMIRTNLRFCGKDRKVIAVTSCIPEEGKSTVTVSLARALQDDGAKVVVVDADLRKSGMYRQLAVRGSHSGLSEFLSGQCGLEKVMLRSEKDGIWVILSGRVPPNPTELFRTETFSQLICTLREQFDYVLLDTPPIGLVIDAAVVSESCDGILWVIKSGKIHTRTVLETRRQLERCSCPVLGAVLNKVKNDRSGYYGSKYYGEYYG